jgi:hypothetical protein
MANITLTGTLLDPNSDLSVGDEIRFTHASTTGQTVKGAISLVTIGPAGTYSVPLQYGLVLVEYKDVRSTQFKNLGIATVNATNTATSIPELLNALVPVSSAELIEFQAILADAVAAAATSEAFANQLTTLGLISSTATFSASTVINTSGYTASGTGGAPWKQNGVTGQTASQSPAQLGLPLLNDGSGNQWALIPDEWVNVRALGAKLDLIQDDLIYFNIALANYRNVIYDASCLVSGTVVMAIQSNLTSTYRQNFITGNFVGGPVVQMRTNYSNVFGIGVASVGARLTSPYNNLSVGIQRGGIGASGSLNNSSITQSVVKDQPGHGIYACGDGPATEISLNIVSECRGHGYLFDDGTQIGQTASRCGVIGVNLNIAQNCGGYGFATAVVGGACYRLTFDDNEVTDCAWNNTEITGMRDELCYIWGQNISWEIGGINDAQFASTTLNNGQTRYAKAARGGGIVIAQGSQSMLFENYRILDVKSGVVVDATVTSFSFTNNYQGVAAGTDVVIDITTNGTVLAESISLNGFDATKPLINNSADAVIAKIDGVNKLFAGVDESGVFLDFEENGTISSGTLILTADTMNVTGEGNLADSIAVANMLNGTFPLPNGRTFTVVNRNAYNITITDSGGGAAAGSFRNKGGTSIVLTTDEAASFKVSGGLNYEV